MEQSDFLELNILGNNDYAKHWDVPVNENFTDIDAECEEIATELLTDPTTPYSGKLRGSAASLQARLNVAMDANGNILYNDYDLEKSRYSRKPWTVPSNINNRIAAIEEDWYVKDRLQYTIDAYSIPTKQAKRTDDRSGLDARKERRVISSDVDLTSRHYRRCKESDFTVDPVFRTIDIPAIGLVQINGVLLNHTIPFQMGYSMGVTRVMLFAAAVPQAGMVTENFIDCQDIRKSTVPGQTNGTCVYGGDTFTSAGIGAASGIRNDWKPEVGQILRIFDTVNYYDYTIKSVSANSVEIDGKFEFGNGVSTYSWEIFDFTQPVFYLTDSSALATEDLAIYALNTQIQNFPMPGILVAFVSINIADTRVSFPTFYQAGFSKYKLLPMGFTSGGLLDNNTGSYTWSSEDLDDVSAASIKSLSVIVIEKYIVGGVETEPNYYIVINPTRPFNSAAPASVYYAQTYQVYIEQGATGKAMSTISSPQSAGKTTTVVLEHRNYGDGGGGTESYWSGAGGNPSANKTLEYVGVLVELL
jgi:hypothetical protein